jgi:uncharacterized protein YfaS (alpha-2-macroglobulin family)
VDAETHPTVSAWVVFGMVKAQGAGFDVEELVLQEGLNYLQGTLLAPNRLNSAWQANRQAFILYVMDEAG